MKHELKLIQKLLAKLVRAECHQFPEPRRKLDAPKEKGVYIIYNQEGRVAHVGGTPRAKGGLHQRLQNYLAGQSSFVKIYLNGKGSRLRKGYKFRCLPIRNPRHRALVEALGIGQLCPKHIGHGLD